jgi:adenylylsulfate kinase
MRGVLEERNDILTARGVNHAGVDLDTLGIGHLFDAAWPDVAYRNLSSVWRNYADAGAARLLLAEAVESAAGLDRIREAVPGAAIVVCRLRADLETMRRRVSGREPGMLHERFVARVTELESRLDAAGLEAFCLSNDDDRAVNAVALEMLRCANWIGAE